MPQNIKELRSVDFCGEFLPNLAKKSAALYGLLKGMRKRITKRIDHTDQTKQVFHEIKRTLEAELFRVWPRTDKEFIPTTYTSESGIGAIPSLKDDEDVPQMVSCFSRTQKKPKKILHPRQKITVNY